MTSHRDAVDVKGLDQVALRDGISQRAIPALIRVDGRYCGDSCTHCVGSLTQHGHVLLLRKLGSIVILIHDGNVDGGWGLWWKVETCTAVSDMFVFCGKWYLSSVENDMWLTDNIACQLVLHAAGMLLMMIIDAIPVGVMLLQVPINNNTNINFISMTTFASCTFLFRLYISVQSEYIDYLSVHFLRTFTV